jgi:hypothetical protein
LPGALGAVALKPPTKGKELVTVVPEFTATKDFTGMHGGNVVPTIMWLSFAGLLITMLLPDLGVFCRRSREIIPRGVRLDAALFFADCPCNAWDIYFAGMGLLLRFHWMNYIFGGLLVFTGAKMAFVIEEKIEPGNNIW